MLAKALAPGVMLILIRGLKDLQQVVLIDYWLSKEMGVLTHFIQGYGRNSTCNGLPRSQGT